MIGIKLWRTSPKAFFRSSSVTTKERCLLMMLMIIIIIIISARFSPLLHSCFSMISLSILCKIMDSTVKVLERVLFQVQGKGDKNAFFAFFLL